MILIKFSGFISIFMMLLWFHSRVQKCGGFILVGAFPPEFSKDSSTKSVVLKVWIKYEKLERCKIDTNLLCHLSKYGASGTAHSKG